MRIILGLLTVILSVGWFPCSGSTKEEAASSLTIESITVTPQNGFSHIKLLVKPRPAGNFEPIISLKKAAQKNLEYFFIGLAMHEEAFWVNLNPNEPYHIIDDTLGNTDLGRIMLNADLRLKEDVSGLINPQVSEVGKEFWQRLYDKAQELGIQDKIPLETRLWIMPGEVRVIEAGDSLSIIKAELKVKLEPAYLTQGNIKNDKRQQELEDFASGLMEELVLPQLDKRVNTAYAYADLREVFHALILAQWYKQKFNPYDDPLLKTAGYGVMNDTELDYSSGPQEIYQDYLHSLKKGIYSFTERSTMSDSYSMTVTTRHYFSGGVDFRRINAIKAAQGEGKQEENLLTCDLFIPAGLERPLQYAKNQVELSTGRLKDDDSAFALARALPAITPAGFAGQRMENLSNTAKMDKIMLSKL